MTLPDGTPVYYADERPCLNCNKPHRPLTHEAPEQQRYCSSCAEALTQGVVTEADKQEATSGIRLFVLDLNKEMPLSTRLSESIYKHLRKYFELARAESRAQGFALGKKQTFDAAHRALNRMELGGASPEAAGDAMRPKLEPAYKEVVVGVTEERPSETRCGKFGPFVGVRCIRREGHDTACTYNDQEVREALFKGAPLQTPPLEKSATTGVSGDEWLRVPPKPGQTSLEAARALANELGKYELDEARQGAEVERKRANSLAADLATVVAERDKLLAQEQALLKRVEDAEQRMTMQRVEVDKLEAEGKERIRAVDRIRDVHLGKVKEFEDALRVVSESRDGLHAMVLKVCEAFGARDGETTSAMLERVVAHNTNLLAEHATLKKKLEEVSDRLEHWPDEIAEALGGNVQAGEGVDAACRRIVAAYTELEKFLSKLAQGGVIVSSAALPPDELVVARAAHRMLVLPNCLGFVYVPSSYTWTQLVSEIARLKKDLEWQTDQQKQSTAVAEDVREELRRAKQRRDDLQANLNRAVIVRNELRDAWSKAEEYLAHKSLSCRHAGNGCLCGLDELKRLWDLRPLAETSPQPSPGPGATNIQSTCEAPANAVTATTNIPSGPVAPMKEEESTIDDILNYIDGLAGDPRLTKEGKKVAQSIADNARHVFGKNA